MSLSEEEEQGGAVKAQVERRRCQTTDKVLRPSGRVTQEPAAITGLAVITAAALTPNFSRLFDPAGPGLPRRQDPVSTPTGSG